MKKQFYILKEKPKIDIRMTRDSVAAGDDIDAPHEKKLSSQHFASFIAWNSEAASVDEISNLVEPLIKAGRAYFTIWGPDCQRVHDIIDEIDAYP